MFSGIGGFESGIQQATKETCKKCGLWCKCTDWWNELVESPTSENARTNQQEFESRWRKRQYATCVGYSEIDKYAIKVYEKQFGGHKNYGNATEINAKKLPDFDLLVGGFPCQAFSIAGKRAGFNDTRGTLFFDIARILSEKRPRHLVLENVKGLLSHDTGKTFQTILGVLADLGYFVEWQVLNSKDFGVPQNRERVFIVGYLGEEPRRKVFPIAGTNKKDTRIIGQDVAYTIDANYHKGTNTLEKSRRSIVQVNQPKHSNDRVYSESGVSPTLNTAQGGNRQPFIPKGARIRRLTPLECERLQGFPDNWTALGVGDEPISDTQRYKMCGNAVTVNVVEAVISNLIGGK